jgi:hypothetical protein
MSNQIVITSGAKVRSLEGVLTGTSGIVSSVPLGAANGVATLDALGKVPLSQLPASVVTYLGTWNAATNTPTLTNGTGDVGDLYICNVAGTVNFGAGPITFASGDWVIYNGSQWQKSAGSSGTVTSVGLASTAGAFTITNSPITTSGNIGLNFSGNSGQYVAGDGSLVTFPSIITQAQNLVTEVYNQTGATLTKGTVVYINGGHGNLPTITKAIATGDATSAQTYGLVRADITNNNNGYVTVIGNLDNMDTQAYADGTQLYLSSTTAGAYTSVKQYAPAHLVYVGIVVRSHPTQGVIEVRIQNGFELDELHNVSAQTPSNNQGIFYNSSTSLWENKSISTALGYTPADDSLVVKLAGTQTITGAKTFSSVITGDAGISLKEGVVPSGVGYTGLAGDADGLLITKRVGSTAYTNLLSFTGSTSNTYAFPNASGTVALTSNLSSYVPYTGATANVDLGSYGLTGYNLKSLTTFNTDKILLYKSGYVGVNGFQRWFFNVAGAESTGNLGSDLYFQAGNDAGTTLYTVASIKRDSGVFRLEGNVNYSGTIGGHLLLKHTVDTFAETGYTSLVSTGSNLRINSYYGSSKIAEFSLSSLTTGAIRTYTLPDLSGTLALLDGTQTFTGSKTFGLNNLIADGGILFKATAVPSSYTTGYVSAWFNINGTKNSLGLASSVTSPFYYFYDFPNASGTLALTSDLSSYVPYTGATTSVNLGAYNLTANLLYNKGVIVNQSSGTANAINFEIATSGQSISGTGYVSLLSNATDSLSVFFGGSTKVAKLLGSSLTATRTYTLPDATGTLVLGTGTTNYLPKFTGASTLGNSLIFDNGTSIGIGTTSPDSNYKLQAVGGIKTNYSRIDGRMFVTNEAVYGDMTSTAGMMSFGYDPTGQEAVIRSRNYTTSTNTKLTFDASQFSFQNGNVGIGTSSPGARLTVATPSGVSETLRLICADTIGDGYMSFYRSTGVRKAYFGYGGSNDDNFYLYQEENAPLYIGTNGIKRIGVNASGSTEIFTYANFYFNFSGGDTFNTLNNGSGTAMYINYNGNGAIYGGAGPAVTIYAGSDERIKENINIVESTLDKVLKLIPKTYNYKERKNNNLYYGFTAQDMEQVFPELVRIADGVTMCNDEEIVDQKSIESFGLVWAAILSKAIQEQQALIQELSAKVSALENKS